MTGGNIHSWKVLIVDRKPEMHTAMLTILRDSLYNGIRGDFLSAYSYSEASSALEKNPDTTVLLVEINSDKDSPGYYFLESVRRLHENAHIRIILRTDFPDQRIDREVLSSFDIDDCINRYEVTTQRLHDSVFRSIRMHLMLKTAEDRLTELIYAQEIYLSSLDCLSSGIITIDNNRNILFLNHMAECLTGQKLSSVSGHSIDEVISLFSTVKKTNIPIPQIGEKNPHGSLLLRSFDGTERAISIEVQSFIRNEEPPGMVFVITDISESLLTEENLLREQKVETIGKLAGGIAHEFNSILTNAMGNTSLAKINTERNSSTYSFICDTERALLRAQGLTRQLLTYTRGYTPLKESISLRSVIDESINIILTGSHIRSIVEIDPKILQIHADHNQIVLCISNILLNAKQSLPNGGTATITIKRKTIQEKEIPPLLPGTYIQISIHDNGTGIPGNQLHKIFDPFYTTKPSASGLGLTTSLRIAQNHGGTIRVESTQGLETIVSIFLPILDDKSFSVHTKPGKQCTESRSILVVDDDEPILATMNHLLSSLGHTVDICLDGKEALLKYSEKMGTPGAYSAVIMDLSIKGETGGEETLSRLREIDPNVCAIASSGYANGPLEANYQSFGFKGFIPKPYRLEDLSNTLNAIFCPDL